MLPTFERRPFGGNRLFDEIARSATRSTDPVSVGTVSKKYVLVQHADAVAALTREVQKAGIPPKHVSARVLLSEYGTRMSVRAALPPEYDLTPEDGHRMALTYECFNSVDGSVPLFAAVGWFRFVCSNGMIVGTPTARVKFRHVPPLKIEEVSDALAEGVRTAIDDRKSFARWHATKISDADLVKFADDQVAPAWGPMAAARVYAISTTGLDGMPRPHRRLAPPHTWSIAHGQGYSVPGTAAPCTDAYQVAQVLAWIASRRVNVAQRLQWRDGIRDLMSSLAPAA